MSTLVEVPATPTVHREASRQKFIDYAVLTLCASLYLLPFMRLLLRGSDEGTLVMGAIRIVHGQVFARDFFEVIGPGTFYWIAAFFKLFGVSFLATRICLFVSSLGIGLSMYFLSRRVCAEYRTLPCILLAGVSFGMLWPTLSHHIDSNFSALLSVGCMVLWLDRRNRGFLIAAGAFAGATMCFHQPKGVLLFAALMVWLCWKQRRLPDLFTSLALLAAGFTAVVGVALAYFWSQGALWDLIYVNFLWPSRHYGGVNAVHYAHGLMREYWEMWAGTAHGFRLRVLLAALLIPPFLLVAALPALLAFFAFRNRLSFARPEIVLYWLCGWAMWAGEFHRKDICHLVFGSPLLIILCVYYLERYRTRTSRWGLQLLAISSSCLACFTLFLVLVASPVSTRFGIVHAFQNDSTIAALTAHVSPGEEIFAYPYCPMYYVLSGAVNPTRYSLLTYNYNTPSQFQEVIQVLEKRRVKWVVWDRHSESLAGSWLFPLHKGTVPDKHVMEPYLASHYKLVQDNGGIDLMERKTEAP